MEHNRTNRRIHRLRMCSSKAKSKLRSACFKDLYRASTGAMTLEKAKELGADLLRGLRYGTDGYFWADTTEGVNVVLYGQKDVEGRNRLEDKDQKGTFYVKEFLAKGKAAGGGYVEYWFPKKGQPTAQPKRSYVLRLNHSAGLSVADTTAEQSERGGDDMCRNIKVLYNFQPPATDDEIRAAALQYVRKISGFAKPSAANERHSIVRWTKSQRRPLNCSARS